MIADHISRTLQNTEGSEIHVVRIPVQVCVLGFCGASLNVYYYKPCGEDAAEAFRLAASNNAVGNLGSGGGGGGFHGGWPGPGPRPIGGGWACTSVGGGETHCEWTPL